MPQFLILAQDGNDAESLKRRLYARPLHIETARKLKDDGHFILGGATLNEVGEMNGSMMVVDFVDEAALRQWLDNDPYVTQNVWENVQVKPFKVANI